MSILIVDDQPENLMLLEKLLSGHGYRVHKAFNGQEALEKLNKINDIELVISDILMPVMDGYQLCRQMHQDERFRSIYFIFYTATYTSDKDIEFGKSLGAEQFIIKPLDPEKFLRIIEQSLNVISQNPPALNEQFTEDESAYLKHYNVRLIEKLEKKVLELEESKYRFATLLKNSLQSFMLIQDGRIVYTNEEITRLTGYSSEEISRFHLAKLNRFIHEEDRHIIQTIHHHDWESEPSLKFETRFYTKSREVKWAMVLITRVMLHNLPAIQITGLDISARKIFETQLQRSENRLRAILESMDDLVFLLDAEGRYVNFFQPGKEEWLIARPEDFVGKHYSQVMPPEIIPEIDSLYEKLKAGEKSGHIEYAVTLKGQTRWFHARVSSLRTPEAVFSGIVIVARDITSRKIYEEQLKTAKKNWENTFNAISDVVLILDKNLKIIRANRAAQQILENNGHPIIGKTCYEVFYGDNSPCDNCEYVQKSFSGNTWHNEIEHKLLNRSFQISSSVIRDDTGEIKNIVQFARDITEFKELQQQYIQAQKMEAIGKLAGGVAHDFNNILTVIEGYSDIILRKLDEVDPMYGQLSQILKAGERARRLTQQLLAFSRKQILQPEVFNLNDLIEELLKMLKRLIGEDIQLITHLDKHLFSVKADFGQIEQIIINLAVNSRDAMPEGGKLIIETQNYNIDEQMIVPGFELNPGMYVQLLVSDTGDGMSQEVIEHCFEPFYTTKGVGKGTGLGLATVHGIVKQSGGQIKVYSEKGYGTTFKIYLPAVQDRAGQISSKPEREFSLEGHETILLVEDEELVRNLSREVLENFGYTVIDSRNGTEAVLYAEKYHDLIHLILTDIIMPQMNGWELAEKVRKSFPDINVLFMSGYSPDVVFQNGNIPEHANFIQKPFLPRKLVRKIREILDKK